MFPRESSCTSSDSSNPSSFPPSSSSSSSSSSASTPTISADNLSLYMHPHYHHSRPPQQHVSYYHDYSRDLGAGSPETAMNSSARHESIQAAISAGYISREQAPVLKMMQEYPSNAPLALAQLQGRSMNYMQPQFYKEEILRSLTGSHGTGVEAASVYERQDFLKSMQAQKSTEKCHEVLHNRSLENLGRSVTSKQQYTIDVLSVDHQTAPAHYDETCTPRPRWSPTQEQIQILEALFNSGTRTPSRNMITEIAAELRKYGTIAEANVFYWFQNRKARAKRKQLEPASRSPASSSGSPFNF